MECLGEKIKAYALEIGINKIGFASAEPFVELKKELELRQQEGRSSNLAKGTIEERTNPKMLMPVAKSLISIVIAYPKTSDLLARQKPQAPYGYFSRSSWGRDYHYVVGEKLEQLKRFISIQYPEAKLISMVDTGVLSDRSIALRAGIGYQGKNGSVISPEFGSFIYLGSIITNLELESDNPLESECGDCERCIKACPVNALYQNYTIDERTCLSYVTQAKHSQPTSLLSKIYDNIYGCDICQMVCPKNKYIDSHYHSECEAKGVEAVDIIRILQMTNKTFKSEFGQLAGSWRGVSVIKRNAIYIARYFRYKEATPYIEAIANNKNTVSYLREAAEEVLSELKALK